MARFLIYNLLDGEETFMQTVIITGMSGAGKSTAVHILEDIGYYCIDNIPPTLISKFIKLCQNSNFVLEKIAFVVDARSGELITRLADEIKMLKKRGNTCKVVFLDTEDAVLIKRYQETRRKHPHMGNGRIEDGIQFERALMSEIRNHADLVIDTTRLLVKELREKFLTIFETSSKNYDKISVNLVSFGFKRGIPLDCDLVFDVRFMPNPFYIDELRNKTGLDAPVRDYVFSFRETGEFMGKLRDMIGYLLPRYREEGKTVLVIAIGCTGGHHRSVAVTHALSEYITSLGYRVAENHRDMTRS